MATARSSSWNAAVALLSCPIVSWEGDVWRCHSRKYPGDSALGSLLATGRFHRGGDAFSDVDTWPALYTALAPHIALGELLRHTSSEALARLSFLRVSRLRVRLQSVLVACDPAGCHDLAIPGIAVDDICDLRNYGLTHQIGGAARQIAEALRIPSCTRFPEGNLIVFPDRLHRDSEVTVIDTVDPELYLGPNPLP